MVKIQKPIFFRRDGSYGSSSSSPTRHKKSKEELKQQFEWLQNISDLELRIRSLNKRQGYCDSHPYEYRYSWFSNEDGWSHSQASSLFAMPAEFRDLDEPLINNIREHISKNGTTDYGTSDPNLYLKFRYRNLTKDEYTKYLDGTKKIGERSGKEVYLNSNINDILKQFVESKGLY